MATTRSFGTITGLGRPTWLVWSGSVSTTRPSCTSSATSAAIVDRLRPVSLRQLRARDRAERVDAAEHQRQVAAAHRIQIVAAEFHHTHGRHPVHVRDGTATWS